MKASYCFDLRLSRTAETARLIAAAVAAAGRAARRGARPEPGLLEIGQGDWEGLTGAEIGERWPEVIAGWRQEPLATWAPGGESVAAVDARVRVAVARVLHELAQGQEPGSLNRSQVLGYRDPAAVEPWAALVGHDGVFKVVLLALLDLPLERFWAFPFALAGISVVEIRGGRGRLRAHNLVEHLPGLDAEDEPARPRGAL